MNDLEIINRDDSIDFILKTPVTLAIITEGGSRAFLKLEEGNYLIIKQCDKTDSKIASGHPKL